MKLKIVSSAPLCRCVTIPVAAVRRNFKEGKAARKQSSNAKWNTLHTSSQKEFAHWARLEVGTVKRKLDEQAFAPRVGSRSNLMLEGSGKAKTSIVIRLSGVSADAVETPNAHLDEWRKLGGDLESFSRDQQQPEVALSISQLPKASVADVVQAVLEGALLAQYRFSKYRAVPIAKLPSLKSLVVVASTAKLKTDQVVKKAKAVAEAVNFARDLINTAPSDLSPPKLIAEVKKIARSGTGISLKLFDNRGLQKLGAGMLLGVARGSDQPAFLAHLTCRGTGTKRKTVVLVGKGITFDSGGLSIKSGKGMEDMKIDMSGAACVLAVAKLLPILKREGKLKHDVHVLIPTCENMINGSSVKPGDILKAVNGKTVEVLNTDAEGRLILGDALSYAARLKPDVVIDVATLTGAIVVSLGDYYAGLFSNDNALRDAIMAASKLSGENMWPMPIAPEYRPLIEGSISDLKNISPGGGPGALIATLFLKEFVPNGAKWAHLDIAGTAAWNKGTDYVPPGGVGFGVRTLARLLEELS